MNWFSNGGRAGTREQRRDVYQVNGLSGVGVKRRSGRSLEVKVRTAVGPKLTIAAGLAAPLEDWRKWTPSFTDSVWPQTGASWVVVDKKLLTRTFTMADDEVVGPASHAGANGGCDVELAAVTVDGIEAWTFAFEAFGPRRHRRAEVLSSWERLVADSGAFDGLGVCFERAAGYPGWLRYVVSQPVGTPHRSRTAR